MLGMVSSGPQTQSVMDGLHGLASDYYIIAIVEVGPSSLAGRKGVLVGQEVDLPVPAVSCDASHLILIDLGVLCFPAVLS